MNETERAVAAIERHERAYAPLQAERLAQIRQRGAMWTAPALPGDVIALDAYIAELGGELLANGVEKHR